MSLKPIEKLNSLNDLISARTKINELIEVVNDLNERLKFLEDVLDIQI